MTAQAEIYIRDRYYGTIRIELHRPPFTKSDEDIRQEVERRLPMLKRKKFTIKLI